MDKRATTAGSLVALCILVLLASFDRVQGTGTDKTVVQNESGTPVVEAVLQKINILTRKNHDLKRHRRFMRRIAWVETEDGTQPFTYPTDVEYHGGIWRVDRSVYDTTRAMYDNTAHLAVFHDIETIFHIKWNQTTWENCRQPLYSALAARLYFHNQDPSIIPQRLEDQAELWVASYHGNPPLKTADDFVAEVSALESSGTECRARGIDLVFVLDSSGSVKTQGFEETKNFVVSVVDFFDIGADKTRVAVIQYSSEVRFEFLLNTYTDKALIKQAVGNIPYLGSGTETVSALRVMESDSFLVENGARDASEAIPRVAVVVTDGRSQGAAQVAVPSDMARERGVTIFAIGVTLNVDNNELYAIANKPSGDYVFYVSNYDSIANIIASLTDTTCNQPSPLLEPVVSSTLAAGRRQYLQQTVTDEGVTLSVVARNGSVVMYISTSTPNPNEALHDYRLEAIEGMGTVDIFIGPENFDQTGLAGEGTRKRRQVSSNNDTTSAPPIGTVYMTIEGVQDTNEFVLAVAEGDVTVEEGTFLYDVTVEEGTFLYDVTNPTATPSPINGSGSLVKTPALLLLCTARLVAAAFYDFD